MTIANPLFAGMEAADVQHILAAGKTRLVKRGELLFTHGEPLKGFYLITSGVLQMIRTAPSGSEKTISILKAGQSVGEDEIMDRCRNHRTSAKAVEETSVLEFPVAWLKETAKTYPEFSLNLLSSLAERTHMAEIEAEHQASMSAAQLVACFLQRLCVIYDLDPQHFDLPYSKTLIASRLGMEPETFSRTLAKLKEHGISVNGNTVSIHDLAQIEEYVCGFCSIAGECATHNAIAAKIT